MRFDFTLFDHSSVSGVIFSAECIESGDGHLIPQLHGNGLTKTHRFDSLPQIAIATIGVDLWQI